jgi:nucleoside-diphosphate-sugar epimerase
MRLTIFGGHGFVGSALAAEAARRGHEVRRIGRDDWPEAGSDLGHVLFTIGMTAGFRERLTETVEAQVVVLHRALTRYRFESFLYLSSTRVYAGAAGTQEETTLAVRPADPDHVYNLSKLAGEALCLAQARPTVRVARLSNVFGEGDRSAGFLEAVLGEAAATGRVTIGQAPGSAKDYISLADVVPALLGIALGGQARLYNVASGRNTSHAEIAALLARHGIVTRFLDNAPEIVFPVLDIGRLAAEFGAPAHGLESHIAGRLGSPASGRRESTT